jgi:hypothetical protein
MSGFVRGRITDNPEGKVAGCSVGAMRGRIVASLVAGTRGNVATDKTTSGTHIRVRDAR